MGQLKDLTGQKFGKLTILRRVEDRKRGRPMWLCQCECGNQTVVSSTRLLLPNGTRSCGCLRHQPSNNLVDLTGKVFGHLTVLRRVHLRQHCLCFLQQPQKWENKIMRMPQRTAQTRSDGARIWISPCTRPGLQSEDQKQRGALEMPLPELRAYRSGEQLLAQDQRPLWSLQMHPVPQT